MEAFKRIVNPYGKVYITIAWNGKRLSIIGVEGPRANGNCAGACGQLSKRTNYICTDSWHALMVNQLWDIWDRWHLNDMRAGTPEQERIKCTILAQGIKYEYSDMCKRLTQIGVNPDNGYSYGSQWLHEDVPEEVLETLRSFPEYDKPLPGAWNL